MARLCWKCGASSVPRPGLDATDRPLHDLTRLLRRNDAPLDSEISVIRGAILEAEERLDVLDSQIRDAQGVLGRLLERREKAVESVRLHRAILSPVRRVPLELLCEILTLSTGSVPFTQSMVIYPYTPPVGRL
ncbi:hypothetical protein C8R43DRAFT_72705 [Mycena crocata]|nr:hypothetical protein C8R43DRAFT_72705 [Mycena crocata]